MLCSRPRFFLFGCQPLWQLLESDQQRQALFIILLRYTRRLQMARCQTKNITTNKSPTRRSNGAVCGHSAMEHLVHISQSRCPRKRRLVVHCPYAMPRFESSHRHWQVSIHVNWFFSSPHFRPWVILTRTVQWTGLATVPNSKT